MDNTSNPPVLPELEVPEGYTEEESTSLVPQKKVTAAGLGGALTVVLIWSLQEFGGLDVPAEVSAAVTTILAFAAGYMKAE